MPAVPLVFVEGLQGCPADRGIVGSAISDALNLPLVEYSSYFPFSTNMLQWWDGGNIL